MFRLVGLLGSVFYLNNIVLMLATGINNHASVLSYHVCLYLYLSVMLIFIMVNTSIFDTTIIT